LLKGLVGENPLPDTVSESRGLIVFARLPELGKVKTRLAATLGNQQALDAYQLMLSRTRETCQEVQAQRHVFFSPSLPESDFHWPQPAFYHHVQVEGDLGIRMRQAFQEMFALNLEKVVIMGTDCPALRPSHLNAAFRALALHDFVVGPALDGGYYLLGMRTLHPSLFEGIAWSTDSVFQDTLAAISRLGKSVQVLDTLRDVDTEEDWEAMKRYC